MPLPSARLGLRQRLTEERMKKDSELPLSRPYSRAASAAGRYHRFPIPPDDDAKASRGGAASASPPVAANALEDDAGGAAQAARSHRVTIQYSPPPDPRAGLVRLQSGSRKSPKRPVSRAGEVSPELNEVPIPAPAPAPAPAAAPAAASAAPLEQPPSTVMSTLEEAVLIDGIDSPEDEGHSAYEGLDTTGTSLDLMQLSENRVSRPSSRQQSRPASRSGLQSGSPTRAAVEPARRSATFLPAPDIDLPLAPTGVFMPSRGKSSPFKVRLATPDHATLRSVDGPGVSESSGGLASSDNGSPGRRESTAKRKGFVHASPDRKPLLSARSTSRNDRKALIGGHVEVCSHKCI